MKAHHSWPKPLYYRQCFFTERLSLLTDGEVWWIDTKFFEICTESGLPCELL